jgi:hypothetical protein
MGISAHAISLADVRRNMTITLIQRWNSESTIKARERLGAPHQLKRLFVLVDQAAGRIF